MKRILIYLCSLLLVLAPSFALAKKPEKSMGKGPTPNASAYENASDNAKFKRGEDWQGGQGKQKDEDDEDLGDDGKKKMKKSKGDEDETDDDGKKKMKKSKGK